MDLFLSKVTQQAMNYAIRSGITITAGFAIRQTSRLLKNVDGSERDELKALQDRLQSKIRIISPAIDMIELIAARGNTSLESAVSLTKDLRWDIQSLGQRLAKAVAVEELSRKGGSSAKSRAQLDMEVRLVIADIRNLLDRIEDAVPLINLAITTSGASLSASLPATVSPSRLLQASTFLTAGDTQYSMSPSQAVQVGPVFTLSVYMLFAGHVRPQDEEGIRNTTWKEVIHKARVKLRRVPMNMLLSTPTHPEPLEHIFQDTHVPGEARADEFAYQLLIIEDLNDGRVHTFDDDDVKPGSLDDVALAGLRQTIPIHHISKIFYADTGKILNIGIEGETNNPVLLLKLDINAVPPRRMMERREAEYGEFEQGLGVFPADGSIPFGVDAQTFADDPLSPSHQDNSKIYTAPYSWSFAVGLDPEWIAFEVYNEVEDSDSETEPESPLSSRCLPRARSSSACLDSQMLKLQLEGSGESSASSPIRGHQMAMSSSHSQQQGSTLSNPLFNSIRTSLSLLETLLRLTSLQIFQQQSHLSITDELLNFFLEESSTTGAGGDEQHRQRIRAEARRKVGWDPYDESPLKRRGEDYQYRESRDDQWTNNPDGWSSDADYASLLAPKMPTDHIEQIPIREGTDSPTIHRRGGRHQSFSPAPSQSLNTRLPISPESQSSPSVKAHLAASRRPTELKRRNHSDKPAARERSLPVGPRTGQTDKKSDTSPGSRRDRVDPENSAPVADQGG